MIRFNGEYAKHRHGVTFISVKKVVNGVISCTLVSSGLISIGISANIITIIKVRTNIILRNH
ncbi:hypothetical protein DPMN_175438 [Dreissena polymorpha]|uniref:Uncharacterized protein n=1 Tax=Dreissena polymorpha TaxID=45954 RepID=A0A9D4IIR3_DREPO|nr:hypothetical protein DPMN_175438 [Dreissena polymorpha]